MPGRELSSPPACRYSEMKSSTRLIDIIFSATLSHPVNLCNHPLVFSGLQKAGRIVLLCCHQCSVRSTRTSGPTRALPVTRAKDEGSFNIKCNAEASILASRDL
jgi:hypothetical protein